MLWKTLDCTYIIYNDNKWSACHELLHNINCINGCTVYNVYVKHRELCKLLYDTQNRYKLWYCR